VFSNKALRMLLIPLIIEQVLSAFMGTVDTMMVSHLGPAEVSGVSLVDSINTLFLYLFVALATGGTVICSQYLGRKSQAEANSAARQVILVSFVFSVIVMSLCLGFRGGILKLIFGAVEPAVMQSAKTYFLITALSYPFIALFSSGCALYRAAGNAKLPMKISAAANIINLVLNYLLIFVFHFGVAGAAVGTLVSRAIAAVILLFMLRRPNQAIDTGPLLKIRPDKKVIGRVLYIGVPTGVENAMFQFGKLAVQSTVSTLGTAAIASNAIISVLELLTSMPSMAIGLGLITVAGQCIGAGRLDEAKKYIKKLTLWSFAALFVVNWAVLALTPAVTSLAGMSAETASLTFSVMLVISIIKPFVWPIAFVPANGMRAAGDVSFNMISTSITMWVFRVGLTTLLCRYLGFGLIGIWCGYFADWSARSVLFAIRYKSGKWAKHHVL